MKTILPVVLLLFVFSCKTTKPTAADDVAAIRNILTEQRKAWSENDIDAFMTGTYNLMNLSFLVAEKITKGYNTTLANYKRNYPTKEDTGELKFEIANITKISDDAYWVMGSYFLTREVGDANGTFMIIFKRINGEWKIIGDSSC